MSDFLANYSMESIAVPTQPGTTPVLSINNWIIFQQRLDNSLSFNRSWASYKNGFGTISGQWQNIQISSNPVTSIDRFRKILCLVHKSALDTLTSTQIFFFSVLPYGRSLAAKLSILADLLPLFSSFHTVQDFLIRSSIIPMRILPGPLLPFIFPTITSFVNPSPLMCPIQFFFFFINNNNNNPTQQLCNLI